jgi:nucleoside-diphosphate-sugar epimerase
MAIAEMVRSHIGSDVDIVVTPTDDHRSYHVSSERIRRDLGFTPRHSVADAITDLKVAFSSGNVPDPMTDDRYYNIKRMQRLSLQ